MTSKYIWRERWGFESCIYTGINDTGSIADNIVKYKLTVAWINPTLYSGFSLCQLYWFKTSKVTHHHHHHYQGLVLPLCQSECVRHSSSQALFSAPMARSSKDLLSLFICHESTLEKQGIWERNIPWWLNYEISNMLVIKSIWDVDVSLWDGLKTSELFILFVREETGSQGGSEGGAGDAAPPIWRASGRWWQLLLDNSPLLLLW